MLVGDDLFSPLYYSQKIYFENLIVVTAKGDAPDSYCSHSGVGRMSWATPADDNPFAVSSTSLLVVHDLMSSFVDDCSVATTSTLSSLSLLCI